MKELLGSIKGKKVIEIGCGNGYFSRAIAKRGAKVTPLDVSSEMIAIATAEEKKKPLGIVYLVCDAACPGPQNLDTKVETNYHCV